MAPLGSRRIVDVLVDGVFKMMSAINEFRANERVKNVVFRLMGDATTCENNVFVQRSLLSSGENLLIAKAFFTEFCITVVADDQRMSSNQPCRSGLGCVHLRIHALLNVIKSKANNSALVMTNSCAGTHHEGHLSAAYNDANRHLEHPFFTSSMCRLVIDKITYAVQMFIPTTHEQIALTKNTFYMPVFMPIRTRQRTDCDVSYVPVCTPVCSRANSPDPVHR